MAINQAFLFFMFTLNGILIGFLFDFFRILRKTFKTTNLVTYIEDIIFWILTGISIIFFMYKFSEGTLRLFMFLGLAFGIILYMLTLSKIIIKTCVSVIEVIAKIIIRIMRVIKIPLKFIYNIFRTIFAKIQVILTKISNKIKFKTKNNKKI